MKFSNLDGCTQWMLKIKSTRNLMKIGHIFNYFSIIFEFRKCSVECMKVYESVECRV